MRFTPGTHLGPYEILGPLGAGGMGEVYRARDTKLDRDVALKVLPSHLDSDPEALERFEREAKAVAALSHPNILAIHDFGSHDGTPFAVTELLEGETLRDRLSAGALPQKTALRFARDIARGLAAAHDKHIVHRDLKPENVFIGAGGEVKILDFGLAKTVQPDERFQSARDLAFALQALSGTQTTSGPSTVAASGETPAGTWRLMPLAVAVVVAVAAFFAGRLLPVSSGANPTTLVSFDQVTDSPGVEAAPTLSPDGRSIVYAVESGGSSDLYLLRVGGRNPVLVTPNAPERDGWPAFSPDGESVAFRSERDGGGIFIMSATGESATRLSDDAAIDWNPVWAPDGRSLYFSSNRGGTMNLWRIPIDESTGEVLGEPEPQTTPSLWSGGFSFSRDGTRMAYASLDWRSTLYRVAFDPVREVLAGAPEPLRRSTRPIRDHELSPDGRWVAFLETGAQEDLFVARTDGTEYRKLTDDVFRDRAPVWSPDGSRLAFYSDRTGMYQLWTIRPDGSGATQVPTGDRKANFPTWSPDGSEIAVSAVGLLDWIRVSADSGADVPPVLHAGPGTDSPSGRCPGRGPAASPVSASGLTPQTST